MRSRPDPPPPAPRSRRGRGRAPRGHARPRSPRAAHRPGAAAIAPRSGPPRGWDPQSDDLGRRARSAWRAGQSRTAVSATRRASRSASSLIASKGFHHRQLDLGQTHALVADLRGIDARAVGLTRADPAVAITVERGRVGAAYAIAFALDEVFVGDRWVSEAGDQRKFGCRGWEWFGDSTGGGQLLHEALHVWRVRRDHRVLRSLFRPSYPLFAFLNRGCFVLFLARMMGFLPKVGRWRPGCGGPARGRHGRCGRVANV